jgi:hypothetical protein
MGGRNSLVGSSRTRTQVHISVPNWLADEFCDLKGRLGASLPELFELALDLELKNRSAKWAPEIYSGTIRFVNWEIGVRLFRAGNGLLSFALSGPIAHGMHRCADKANGPISRGLRVALADAFCYAASGMELLQDEDRWLEKTRSVKAWFPSATYERFKTFAISTQGDEPKALRRVMQSFVDVNLLEGSLWLGDEFVSILGERTRVEVLAAGKREILVQFSGAGAELALSIPPRRAPIDVPFIVTGMLKALFDSWRVGSNGRIASSNEKSGEAFESNGSNRNGKSG